MSFFTMITPKKQIYIYDNDLAYLVTQTVCNAVKSKHHK